MHRVSFTFNQGLSKMYNKKSILGFLDKSFDRLEMPSFGSNMNIDYVSSRLSAYCSADQWLLLFN